MIRRILLMLGLLLLFAQPALALSNEPGSDPTGQSQRYVIERTPWLDPTACNPGSTPTTGGGGGGAAGGKIFVLGDSIIAGSTSIKSDLEAKGFTDVIIDAVPSRKLTGNLEAPTNDPLDGMSVLAKDVDQWKDAGTIVIELGTNLGLTSDNIDKTLAFIRQKNSGAKIFWVNSYLSSSDRTDSNALLTSKSSVQNFTVINWFDIAKTHPEYLSDGVHPNSTGYPFYINNIIDSLGGVSNSSSSAVVSTGCRCNTGNTTGTTTLIGDDAVEQAYNFFIAPERGLTPAQSAGIVGNLMLESGGNTTVNPDALNSIGAYGIAQWLGGRKDALEAYAASKGKPKNDLSIQLEFLWSELSAGNQISVTTKKDFLSSVTPQTTPSEAAKIFEDTFERSGGAGIPQRVSNAESVFASFGSNSPTPGGSPGPSGTGGCDDGSDSTIDPTLPQGTAEELFTRIKESGKVTANVELLGAPGVKATILAVVLKLTEKYSFSIGSVLRPGCGCPHDNGSAVDLGNINGEGVPTGENYEAFNQTAADFSKDAATLLPPGGSYMGVPNERFKAIAEPIITAKGGSILIETRANGLAEGAHFHLNVPASAP